MTRYHESNYYDDGDIVHDLHEVFARYARGEVREALYELEKLMPQLKDIHKYASDKKVTDPGKK